MLHFKTSGGTARLIQISKDGKVSQWLRGARSTLPLKILQSPSNAATVTASTVTDTELVIGCSNGHIYIMNLNHGTQQELTVDKSRVSAVSVNDATIVVGTIEGQLFEFARIGKDGNFSKTARLIKDELGAITALTTTTDTIYIGAKDGIQPRAIDSQTGAAVAKWPKCRAPPIFSLVKVDSSRDASLLIAFNDRQIHFARSPKETCVLVGKSKAVHVEVNQFRNQRPNILVLSVQENGTVSLYLIPKKSSETQIRPISIVKIIDDALKIFAATFSEANKIALTYGNKSKPSFETITFEDKNGTIESTILVTPSSQSLFPESEDANARSADGLKKQEGTTPSGNFAVVNPFDLKVPQLNNISETVAEESTVPFGERVKSQITPVTSKGPAKVESIDAVLIQALKTKDQDLLNRVFQTSNSVLVKRTIEKLPQNSVLPLLLYAVEKFQTNPSMASQLTTWINAVLTIHLSYLMSLPSLPKTLSPLYSVIESRMAVFQDLLKLQGRLDLLVSQIDRRRANLATLNLEPNQVYREAEENGVDGEIDSDEADDDDLSEESDALLDDEDAEMIDASDEEMEDASE